MAWNESITNKLKEGLQRYLIIRDPETRVIRVNFSYDLSSLLREVGYLKKEFPHSGFPDIAGELYEREEIFRSYNISLDLTVTCYNRLKSGTKDVEFALIKSEIHDIDKLLERAENHLNWNSEGTCYTYRYLVQLQKDHAYL